MSCLVPVPKMSRPSDPADYRPVTLTSHVMKVLERLVLAQLRPHGSFLMTQLLSGVIREGEEGEYRTLVDNFVEWSEQNHLRLNVNKTREMVIDFRRKKMPSQPLRIRGEVVEEVEDYKYLGVVIDNRLDWKSNTGGCVQEGDEQTLFPEEAEILQQNNRDSPWQSLPVVAPEERRRWRKRGSRAGVLVRLRKRENQPPLNNLRKVLLRSHKHISCPTRANQITPQFCCCHSRIRSPGLTEKSKLKGRTHANNSGDLE
ncbi:hypothetical protein L3Q82_000881 [Scortum barcoo]|uniref:Uncharacterized protein n=1 Tax=Scortum barcoo TaxID=214431 RepID=A0ACB8WDN1_9TELE|nr:hypothetical protein L3Q82_000881 [Scortum barcoo]